ncbi:MAG: hypothetical protein V1827_02675 [Candidatus Micrarchaeota archaeon]
MKRIGRTGLGCEGEGNPELKRRFDYDVLIGFIDRETCDGKSLISLVRLELSKRMGTGPERVSRNAIANYIASVVSDTGLRYHSTQVKRVEDCRGNMPYRIADRLRSHFQGEGKMGAINQDSCGAIHHLERYFTQDPANRLMWSLLKMTIDNGIRPIIGDAGVLDLCNSEGFLLPTSEMLPPSFYPNRYEHMAEVIRRALELPDPHSIPENQDVSSPVFATAEYRPPPSICYGETVYHNNRVTSIFALPWIYHGPGGKEAFWDYIRKMKIVLCYSGIDPHRPMDDRSPEQRMNEASKYFAWQAPLIGQFIDTIVENWLRLRGRIEIPSFTSEPETTSFLK